MTKPKEVEQKRKVVMRTAVALPDGSTVNHEAVDFVPVDILDAYVEDARERWQLVLVPDPETHDPGPAGDKGKTVRPSHLSAPKE